MSRPESRPHASVGRTLSALMLAGLALVAAESADGAIIGYHDSSDPVKTLGWACDSSNASPVRVNLYAESESGRTLIDSQLADKRRDDLQAVCPDGYAHAFRFSDYAIRSEGIALLSAAGPVTMHVAVETGRGLVDLPGTPRAVSFTPVGIHDDGLVRGRWRTDRDDPFEGTSAAPLLLGDCAFASPLSDGYPSFAGGGTDPVTGCRYGQIINAASNAASSEAVWLRDDFWVVVANRENAFDNAHCVSGPPGQSGPIGAPGSGKLFGVVSLPDAETGNFSRRKMHLVLNSRDDTDCRTNGYGIPYLSVGAQADRGNGGILTYLNAPGAKRLLTFGITLMDIADRRPDAFAQPAADARRYSQAHLLVEALWGSKKRWLFVELLPDARLGADGSPTGQDAHFRFNWHMVNSFINPGADYVFKSAAVLTAQCSEEGVSVPGMPRDATYVDPSTRARARTDYAIDLQRVFDCLNRLGAWGAEPMPAHPIPVTGVHFGIEQDDVLYRNGVATETRAPNAIWIAVDNVRLE